MGSRNALPADFKAVIAYLERGTFPIDEVVTQVVPLSEAAYERLLAKV
jgi:threonine dehydrogenase-like Zn-dependent dehydrogenase